jgi:cyclic dehypoxanthinyl futalosine synthase
VDYVIALVEWHILLLIFSKNLSIIHTMQRIDKKQALELLHQMPLLELATQATKIKDTLHRDGVVTFVVDRNINYTNICVSDCKFCAFKREYGEEGGYLLDFDTIAIKIQELIDIGGTQILFQGGVHPKLKIDFYEDLVGFIHQKFPSVTIHAFSAVEIDFIARLSKIPIKEVLQRLKNAGLSSMPGAGAEILSDRVRDIISPKKNKTASWLEVHKTAHELGINTTATMMFGSVESDEEILEHFELLRQLQDETGGFRAFILWSFQPDFTPLKEEFPDIKKASSNRYLRLLALSRIYLENFKNIQSSWVTQGGNVGQSALYFGANDMGGAMMEENVVAAAGVKNRSSEDELVHLIKKAGFRAAKRDTAYNILKHYD